MPSWVAPVVLGLAVVLLRTLFGWFWRGRGSRSYAVEGQQGVLDGARLFAAQKWDELIALYEDRSASDRYHFLRGLGEITSLKGRLPPNPTGSLAIIVAGIHVSRAWRYRGHGMGATVSESAGAGMMRELSAAALLLDVQAPNSVACALRIRAEMGIGGSRGVLQRQLNAVAELSDEPNIFVPVNHILFVAPKWHGSVDEMFEVAREYASSSDRPAWVALPAVAHTEGFLFRTVMSDDAADKQAANEFYLRSAEFGAELEVLDDAFWQARRKSGAFSHAELLLAHNYLAYLLYCRGMNRRLAAHVENIGRDLMAIPWGYRGIPPSAINDVRRQAGLPPL